jgi:hypothetical protein
MRVSEIGPSSRQCPWAMPPSRCLPRRHLRQGRAGASVVAKTVAMATGITTRGEREVLGCAVGDSEDGAFWTAFQRDLRWRSLAGVRLSRDHPARRAAPGWGESDPGPGGGV